jgi:hypothetical protein
MKKVQPQTWDGRIAARVRVYPRNEVTGSTREYPTGEKVWPERFDIVPAGQNRMHA